MIDTDDLEYRQDSEFQEFGSYCYSADSQIRKLDESMIILKMAEKYPDLSEDSSENTIKAVFLIMFADSKFICKILDYYSISIFDLMKILYRKYSHVFNQGFITKLQYVVRNRKYTTNEEYRISDRYSVRSR